MNTRAQRKGYRKFHPVTSPLVIIGAGLVGFWIAYFAVYFTITYFSPRKIAGTPTVPV